MAEGEGDVSLISYFPFLYTPKSNCITPRPEDIITSPNLTCNSFLSTLGTPAAIPIITISFMDGKLRTILVVVIDALLLAYFVKHARTTQCLPFSP